MARKLQSEIIELPIGVKDKNGVIHKLCEFTEMDGNDEEAITDRKVASNGALVVSTLLERKIVKIGDIEKITPTLIKNMFSADRDAVLMGIRKLSLGSDMTIQTQCPSCKQKSQLIIDLDNDIECPMWDSEENELFSDDDNMLGLIEFELPIGYEDKDGEVHRNGLIRMSTGELEEKLALLIRENPGKANTVLLSNSIQELGTLKMIDTKVLRDMTRRDREYLTSLISKAKCGPNLVREVNCPVCGFAHKVMIELPYFFTANSEL